MIRITATCLLPFILLFSVFSEEAWSQFEGQIEYRAFEPDRPDIPHRMLTFTATPDRIFLNSEYRYRVFAGMDADGFLVRNDRDDFVFLSGESDALLIKKSDVDGLSVMIRRMQGGNAGNSGEFDWDGQLNETGETKMIHGYSAEKIEVIEQDTENIVAIWLTDEIKVNWGILDEVWHQSLSMVVNVDLPVEVIMNRNSFPLEIEYYEGDRLATVVETINIDQKSINSDEMEIPEGVTLLGMTDLMMRMMRN